jgi:carboxypeptidase PM20D1
MVWGRGALDDKSTVMALMEAMELTLAAGDKLQRTIYFSFGHDEEIGGKQGASNIAKYFTEKGISFEFVLDEGGVILDKGMMPGIDKQVAIIGIAEKGFVNIRLVVDQLGGHSSQPPEHTGPGVLAQAIVKLEENKFPTDLSFTNMTFDKIGFYTDFSSKLAMSNQWLFAPIIEKVMISNPKTAASIRTTTAVTMLSGSSKSNILPTTSTAVVNFLIMPGQTYETVADYVKKTINDPSIKLEVFMESNPSPVSKTDSFGYQLLEQTIREFDEDILVAPYMVQGGTDAKYFYPLSNAIYRFIMVKISNELLSSIHGIDERIVIDDYILGVQFFHQIIKKSAVNIQ